MIKHLNKNLKFLGEIEFPDRVPLLFGDDFGKRAKSTADNVSALKGLSSKIPRVVFQVAVTPNKFIQAPGSLEASSYHKLVFMRLDSLSSS